jgi:hypothetical protein
MSRRTDHPHGTFQLEDLLRALQGVHEALPTERGTGMTARELEGLYFVLQELLQRLEDVLDCIVGERRQQKQPQQTSP